MNLLRFAVVVGFLSPWAGRAAGEPVGPTFAKDVAPILFANCSSCHRSGEIGPFSLLTYQDARKRAGLIAQITEEKVMPPWKPAAGHGEFKEARTLSDGQIALLKAWAAAGAPQGDASDLPPTPEFPQGWHLGEPDLIVSVAEPYSIPAAGPDVYVHFVLPMDLDRDRHIRAVQVLPSNRRVAHHGVPILDGSGKARKLAAAQGGDHYQNFGGPGFIPQGFLPGYAPGQTTRIDSEDDRGLTLPKGADIVLQMHYHPSGKVEVDQPRIGLYFTDKKPGRNPNILGLANNDIDIPAEAERYQRADSLTLPVDFEVRDIWGHMHMIGRETKVWAELPNGKTKNLLFIPDWDFNWQDTYHYKEPFTLPRGTVVRAEWTWNNTATNPRNPNSPPKRTLWGEGSTDEMSGLIVGGITVNPTEEGLLWIYTIGHYLNTERKANDAKSRREAATTSTR